MFDIINSVAIAKKNIRTRLQGLVDPYIFYLAQLAMDEILSYDDYW